MKNKNIFKLFYKDENKIILILILLIFPTYFTKNTLYIFKKMNGGTIIEMNIKFIEIGEQYIFKSDLLGGFPNEVYINNILQDSNRGKYNMETTINNITMVWNRVFGDCRFMFDQLSNIEEMIFLRFDTSSVTDMGAMFRKCTSLKKLDISIFDTKNVFNIGEMFSYCSSLTSLDISNFNTDNIKNMNNLFSRCYCLTSLNLTNFNTTKATVLHSMFNSCYNLAILDLSNLYINNADVRNIFYACNNLKYIKLYNYREQNIFGTLSQNKTICTDNFDEIKNIIPSFSVNTINDCSIFPFANYPQSIIIKVNNKGYQNIFSNDFIGNKLAKVLINGQEQTISDDGKYQLNEIINNITIFWERYPLNDTRKMFYGLTNLLEINFTNFDTSFVTHMGNMFEGCSNLKFLNISLFDTSNVQYSFNMFKDCYLLDSLDLSNFNTSINYDFSQMFKGCNSLLSINLSNFKTNRLSYLNRFFDGCHSLKSINLSNFNIENVETMEECFKDCINLEILDLSNFDTSYVTNFNKIFYNCEKLKYIKLFQYTGIDIFKDLIQDKTICTDNYELLKKIAPSLKINTEVDCLIYPFTNYTDITYIPSSYKNKNKLIKLLNK